MRLLLQITAEPCVVFFTRIALPWLKPSHAQVLTALNENPKNVTTEALIEHTPLLRVQIKPLQPKKGRTTAV